MLENSDQQAITISELRANFYKEVNRLAYPFFQDLEKMGLCELERQNDRFIIKKAAWRTSETRDEQEPA